jgi:DNA-binding MarR family transcriptional regulator
MQDEGAQLEATVVEALRQQVPLRGIPGVRIENVKENPRESFDVSFDLVSGQNRVPVLAEIKKTVSPKVLEEIAPWVRRMKSLKEDAAFALACPALSLQSQDYCVRNGIDFLDLAGNIYVNVPGKFTLQRLGMRSEERNEVADSSRNRNVFSGRSSRVLRVLLQKPKQWTLTEIAKELTLEQRRMERVLGSKSLRFEISSGSISKALSSLEEQLWIRRQGSAVLIPEPKRLLREWAEKYKERYRWRLRSSFEMTSPFGAKLSDISQGLRPLLGRGYAFTGAAASIDAPFVDVDRVEVFLADVGEDARLRRLLPNERSNLKLRFIYPYDSGVFMYARKEDSIPVVSNIQAYLDLYARGGRDLKQADHLLANAIEPAWTAA